MAAVYTNIIFIVQFTELKLYKKGIDQMRKQIKKLAAIAIAVVLVVLSMSSAYAASPNSKDRGQQKNNIQLSNVIKNNDIRLSNVMNNGIRINNVKVQQNNAMRFSDVNEKSLPWAYGAIMNLAGRGVINGIGNGKFEPNGKVTREQFAKMLVNTLNLTTTDNTQIFADVPLNNTYFGYIEAAKSYLTGYRTSNGAMYFYGSNPAVREDMAVALVKALNIPVVPNNGALAQIYKDYSKISPNLQDYVYAAYTSGLMLGSSNKFDPQGNLTRAQAAVLLERALNQSEKVVMGDGNDNGTTKVIVGDSTSTSAILSSLSYNGTPVSGFAAHTYTYTVQLPAGTTTVPAVTATVTPAGATYAVKQAPALPGAAVVTVTAANGTNKNYYVINFTVALSTDASLKALTYNGTSVPGFASNIFSYNVTLPAGTTTLPIVAALENYSGATDKIIQAATLPGTAVVVVAAADNTTKKSYVINFTVAP